MVGALAALPQLRSLSLRRCQAVTDGGLRSLAAGAGSRLEGLRLDECGPGVTDAGLAALASQCGALRVRDGYGGAGERAGGAGTGIRVVDTAAAAGAPVLEAGGCARS